MLRLPSITRWPPTTRIAAVVRPVSSGGTTREIAASRRARSCSARIALAWKPAQRAKKSDSVPPALSVSIICTPLNDVASTLPCSCSKRRLASVRRRALKRRATRLSRAMHDADDRQQHVVLEHHDGVERDHREVDHVGGEAGRQQLGDAVVELRARRDVGGVAQVEEPDRQMQHVPEEPARRGELQLLAEPEQDVLLQPVRTSSSTQRQRPSPATQRRQPVRRARRRGRCRRRCG